MGVIQKLLRLLHMIRERGAGEEEQFQTKIRVEDEGKAVLRENRLKKDLKEDNQNLPAIYFSWTVDKPKKRSSSQYELITAAPGLREASDQSAFREN